LITPGSRRVKLFGMPTQMAMDFPFRIDARFAVLDLHSQALITAWFGQATAMTRMFAVTREVE
jgi:hypothetical protein